MRVVDIDEESLARIGQWPWPRTTVRRAGRPARRPGRRGRSPSTFCSPSRTDFAGAGRCKRLPPEEAARLAAADRRQAEPRRGVRRGASGEARRVLATALSARAVGAAARSQGRASPSPATIRGRSSRSFRRQRRSNLPILDEAATGIGSINWIPDRDQVVRRIPLVYRARRPVRADAVRRGAARRAGREHLCPQGVERQRRDGVRPADRPQQHQVSARSRSRPTPTARIWLQFRPSNPAAFIPAWKVLAGENDPNEVAGGIILVGTSAPGLIDLRATPLDAALPGVEIHAQAIEHVLSRALADAAGLCRRRSSSWSMIAARRSRSASSCRELGAGAAGAARRSRSSSRMLRRRLARLQPARTCCSTRPIPALALGLLVALATLYVYRRVEQQRGEVRRAFSHYVVAGGGRRADRASRSSSSSAARCAS